MHDCASILDRMYRTYQLNYRSFNEDDEIAVLPISKPHSDTSIFHIYSVATMMMYTLNSFCGCYLLVVYTQWDTTYQEMTYYMIVHV